MITEEDVGFTGTRHGMENAQQRAFHTVLDRIRA